MNALVGRIGQFVFQLFQIVDTDVRCKSTQGRIHHAQCFLEGFLQRASDTHDFTHRLHRTADRSRDALELTHIPSRYLGDNVIQRRFETRLRFLRDLVHHLRHSESQTQLGGHKRQRIPGRFGSQRGGSTQTRIDLNNGVLERRRMQRVLNVALPDDTQVTNDPNGRLPQHVVLLVTQRLGRCHDHTVAGVDSQRIEILHVADGDTVVHVVADDLVLDLLPSQHGLLD
mmetsp:Transcript_23845/g.35223  ORF Transcript_23845/g.35223 Transcript_23845/m.35223 type:complete len:228 (+) Transcript_23845:915-1598(+)